MTAITTLLQDEQWVIGYEGKYSITRQGEVYSHINGKKRIRPFITNGYKAFTVFDSDGIRYDKRVHREVYKVFANEPLLEGGRIFFKDKDRNNVSFDNLYKGFPQIRNKKSLNSLV